MQSDFFSLRHSGTFLNFFLKTSPASGILRSFLYFSRFFSLHLIRHEVFHSLAPGARIVISTSFQKVNDAPYAEPGAEGDYQGLRDLNCTVEKIHTIPCIPNPQNDGFLSFSRFSTHPHLKRRGRFHPHLGIRVPFLSIKFCSIF